MMTPERELRPEHERALLLLGCLLVLAVLAVLRAVSSPDPAAPISTPAEPSGPLVCLEVPMIPVLDLIYCRPQTARSIDLTGCLLPFLASQPITLVMPDGSIFVPAFSTREALHEEMARLRIAGYSIQVITNGREVVASLHEQGVRLMLDPRIGDDLGPAGDPRCEVDDGPARGTA